MSSTLDDILAEASALSLSPAGTGVLRSVASHSADAPTRVVGVLGLGNADNQGTTSSKKYSVVTVCGSDLSLCFGVVGVGGVSFCIRKNCRVKSHEDSKFWLSGRSESIIFISRVQDAVVFIDPSVNEDLVTLETLDDWKGKTMTLPNWVRSFRAVSITDKLKVSVDDIKLKTKFLIDAERFRTPAKKRMSEWDDNDKGIQGRKLNEVTIELLDSSLPSVDDTDALDAVIIDGSMLKGGLTRIVARVEANVSTLGNALKGVVVLTHDRFIDNEKDVELMSGVIQNLHATIGYTVGLDPRFEAPTLWGTMSFVAEEVSRLGSLMVDAENHMIPLKESLNELKIEHQRLSSTVSGRSPGADDKMIQALMHVMNYVKKVNPELDKIRDMVQHLKSEISEVRETKRQRTEENADCSKTQGGIDTMEELMNMMTSSASVGGESTPKKNSVSPDKSMCTQQCIGSALQEGNDRDIRRMKSEISLLIADVGSLKASAEDKSVKFGGLGLRSLQECHEWVGEKFSTLRYGLVMDPLLMLDRICGADDADAENQFKILESRVKLRITTGAEAAAIKALNFSRPRLIHKGRVAMSSERNSSKLSKLPNFKSWKSAGEGVRNYVTKQMNLIHSTISHDIVYAFGNDPNLAQAQGLATASLNASVTFLTQLLGFVDTIYEKLHVDSRFTSEQAWSLTTQILDRICEDLYAPKEGVADAMTVGDPVSICSHVLWSCLRTHDVMSGYIDLQFENHPAISAEYVKFLATNSGYDKVEKMEGVIANLTDKLNKSVEETKKAISKADVASTKYSDLAKEVQMLVKKVKSLEDKGGR